MTNKNKSKAGLFVLLLSCALLATAFVACAFIGVAKYSQKRGYEEGKRAGVKLGYKLRFAEEKLNPFKTVTVDTVILRTKSNSLKRHVQQ